MSKKMSPTKSEVNFNNWTKREKVLLTLLIITLIDIKEIIFTLYHIGLEFGQALTAWF